MASTTGQPIRPRGAAASASLSSILYLSRIQAHLAPYSGATYDVGTLYVYLVSRRIDIDAYERANVIFFSLGAQAP